MGLRSITQLTDRTGDDTAAFVHAAALAAATGARLVTVHGNAGPEVARELPDPGELAARWGCAIVHERVCHDCCDDVAETLVDAVHRLAPDLVVAGTHARRGVPALVHGSVAEAVARNVRMPTLFVPNTGRGFVDPATGAFSLARILVPAAAAAMRDRGVTSAAALIAWSRVTSPCEIVVVHVGPELPPIGGRALPVNVRVVEHAVRGAVDRAIVEAADRLDVCAIVMPTRGHDGLVDSLLGSHTEHVIRTAARPVLSIPVPRGI
jgi:nucleotide-binding universal stress UspA family protein